MKVKAKISIFGFLLFLFSALVFNVNVINSQASVDITASALKQAGKITIDGVADETEWTSATSFTFNVEIYNVSMKMVHDGVYLYTFATWNDSTADNLRKGWNLNASSIYENNGQNEDRFDVAWKLSTESIVCGHDPAGTGTTKLFDVWHWKATRTNPSGWADDKYWDGTGRHADAKTSGGYKDNSVVVQSADAAEISSKLGNTTEAAIFGTGDLPFWDPNSNEINWTSGTTSDILPNFIPGYLSSLPVGSRGDVVTMGVHTGSIWNLEMIRKLDTGNTDDILFEAGKQYTFNVAIHNNSGGASHKKSNLDFVLYIQTFSEAFAETNTVTDTVTETKTQDVTVATTTVEQKTSPGFELIAILGSLGVITILLRFKKL